MNHNPLTEESRIIFERFNRTQSDPREFRMSRIKEPVGFNRNKSRRHDKNNCSVFLYEPVADRGEFRRCWAFAPVRWQLLWRNGRSRDAVGNLNRCDDEILRRIIPVEVDEVLNHRKRKVFRCICETSADTRPPAAKTECAFSVKRVLGKAFAQDPVNPDQLTPP